MAETNIGELANTIYQLLRNVRIAERRKILKAAMVLLGEESSHYPNISAGSQTERNAVDAAREPVFSKKRELTPKQFLHEKEPRSDTERVACLAYYLASYRDQATFKTLNISQVNTEAAQKKFANPADAVNNTLKRGLIAQAVKGSKQISAVGERFVEAMPDRSEAKLALEKAKPRRPRKKAKPKAK